ncbi:hypothetical protein ACQBAU_09835 [Propionibacteriaceae bacterium Y2011]|uniref:hypothetical protein n=1 Tax=Microlunatus sp. Y2014 TaxID=3418488 RepID=UPI003B453B1B
MKSRIGLLAGALAAAAALVAAPVSIADAALTTSCVGEAGAVTVPGDLVVPAGKSCVLDGTTVEGRVTVRSGADLVVTNGTFNDRVVVQANGYLDLTDTTVAGRVVSQGGYGTYAAGSSIQGYTENASSDVTPFLYAENVDVESTVVAKGGELFFTGGTARAITAENVVYADVINSTLTRTLAVSNAEFGTQVCASEVDGDATFEGNAGVQLGSGALFGTCDGGSNYFGGNVTVNNSTEGVEVNGNIVRGNLAGTGNDPAPTGADNRVRGAQEGQFAELQAPAAAKMSKMSKSAVASHDDEIKASAKERKGSATAAAAAAGPANL